MNRREFLTRAALTGAAAYGLPIATSVPSVGATRTGSANKPNILVIMVDQLREPMWSPPQARLDALLPSFARLRQGAVCFGGHYCAASACSPSRASFLTGLYAYQHGLLTNVDPGTPELDPGFKTWGSALRDYGYKTHWYGKWHLSKTNSLEPYGFENERYPDAHSEGLAFYRSKNPGLGISSDEIFADSFVDWFDKNADKGPWATAVSLLNPHDICLYPKLTPLHDYLSEHPGPLPFTGAPQNYETADQMAAQNKPRVLRDNTRGAEKSIGLTSSSTLEERHQAWMAHNNAYFALWQAVDAQIGRVLDTLDKRPEIRDNTIIVFLADHGENGGSHGLRGKGIGVYEEEVRVPLYIKDPTGTYTSQTNIMRPQLVSTVDLYALMLTIASGGNDWRALPEYSHLADRFDIAAVLKSPAAQGRSHILHTTGPPYPRALASWKEWTEPIHTVAYRTNDAKLAIYSQWPSDRKTDILETQEFELYDYNVEGGRQETLNDVKAKPGLFNSMRKELAEHIVPGELERPLPPAMQEIRDRAVHDYLNMPKPGSGSV